MRSREPRREWSSFLADLIVAVGLLVSFAYLIIVVEYHVGAGELTHAQLQLLVGKTRAAHAVENNQRHLKSQEDSTHG
jgi:hypothetical protein